LNDLTISSNRGQSFVGADDSESSPEPTPEQEPCKMGTTLTNDFLEPLSC